MLEYIYPFVIIIGLTSLAVAFYFSFLIKRILKILTLILSSQISSTLSVKEYIEQLASNLETAGVQNIIYRLSYSKSMLSNEEKSLSSKTLIKKTLKDTQIEGYIAIDVKNNKGEQKILNNLILFIITLQITNQIRSKIYFTNESFKKISQLQTYIMHDLKNILQFFQLMQYNVKNIQTSEQQERFINHLKNNTEPINKKVNKILALLHTNSSPSLTSKVDLLSLRELFSKYIEHYKLNCTLNGDASVITKKELIEVAVDNILENIHDKYLLDDTLTCVIEIEIKNEKVYITISDTGYEFKNPHEICEAFYTTKLGGSGIGMYQVATVIEELEGEIIFKNINGYPHTIITLPYKN